jgi:hypothetical protein
MRSPKAMGAQGGGKGMQVANKVFAIFSSLVCCAAAAYAANVSGTVKGPDGAPFEGAFVQAQNI